MTDIDRGQAVTVSCRECRCPGTPGAYHPTDETYLAPEPSLRLGLSAQIKIQEATRQNTAGVTFDAEAATLDLFETFIRYGVTGWNLVDGGGMAVPLDIETILADMSLGMPTADKASTLYLEKVTAPLVKRLAEISRSGQTADSKSARKKSTTKRHKQSSPAGSVASLRSVS